MKFYTKYAIITYLPLKRCRSKKHPIWFSRPLISTLNRKFKVWSKWKTYGSLSDYNEFSLLRTRTKLLLKECFHSYIVKVQSSIQDNPKYFWQFISSMQANERGYPAVMTLARSSTRSPNEVSEFFSTFFGSVFEPASHVDDVELFSI